jgi:uncharacterized protein YebE (UPF0316 family)
MSSMMPWYLPLLIFVARVCDVSLGTMRTMLVVSGIRWLPPILGFCEVTIWVLAAAGVLTHLTNWIAIVAYAGGFATGIAVGMMIEDRLAIGYRIMRVINTNRALNLSARLRAEGYRVTTVDAHGRDGPVEMAFLVAPRRKVSVIQEILKREAPEAFVTVERVDRPSGGAWGRSRASVRPMPGLAGFGK